MKQKTKKIIILLAAILVLPLVGSMAHTAADSDPNPVSYLQIYSAKGTYTKAKISINGPAGQISDHHCGGTLDNTSSHSSVSIKLYATRPHRILCAAISPPYSYTIQFIKGNQTTYYTLPDSSPGVNFSNVDVNNNTTISPYKSCTVIEPSKAPKILNSNCPGAHAETIPKDTATLTIALTQVSNVNPNVGPKATIKLADTTAWDGNPVTSKVFCLKSTVGIQYQRTDIPNQPLSTAVYRKALRYRNGACQVIMSRDHYKFAHKATYVFVANFNGNAYLNAATPVTSPAFKIK